ncbi:MAG: PAS domain S-box protein [Bacteroidota bacterium]|nr:PAS domain S-box protein [Bacteroidota bacterium]
MNNRQEKIPARNTVELKISSAMTYAVFAGLFGIAFPVLGYIILFLTGEYSFSLTGFIQMNRELPVMIIIDTAPFVLFFSAYFLGSKIGKDRQFLMAEITELESVVEQNLGFAHKIGNGDFSTTRESIPFHDKLGNSLYEMQKNLVNTSQKENEQNWIGRGKEIIADILRKHNNIEELADEALISLVTFTDSIQGAFYIYDEEKEILSNVATYAYNRKKYISQEYNIGQGLVGQAAFEKKYIYRKEIPEDYFTIQSGILGEAKPQTLLISPFFGDEKLQGVVEISSLKEEMPNQMIILMQELSEVIGQTLFNLQVNSRTEKLLKESQSLTKRLRKNEDELKENAQQMELSQVEIKKSNEELAAKISEVEQGQKRLHALLENASEAITIYDENGIVKYVSPSVKNILGFHPEEMIGTNRFKRGEAILQEAFNALIDSPKESQTFEYRYENKDKQMLWLETIGRNLSTNPAINGILFNTRDITVRKVAEKAQRLSGEMQALSENSPDMIMRLGPDYKIYYANPMVSKYLGVSSAEATDNYLENLNISEKIKEKFESYLKKVIETGEVLEEETTISMTKKSKNIFQFNAIPEFNNDNELETILFVAHDITERKQIEIEIERKNKSITESINYAKRIQTAIIPDKNYLNQFIPESFIFYRPRDVVSGDFPWMFDKGEDVYIAAVDCTGHGVPGALLSFIGYFILNNIVSEQEGMSVGEILNMLHAQVRKTLKQDSPDAKARDGMDLALCKINSKSGKLYFSGAHRPLYRVRDGEVEVFKGDPKAIGGRPLRAKKEKSFTSHELDLQTKDQIYIFSDGLQDQIGGDKGRKYQARRIRNTIAKYSESSMAEMHDVFDKEYITWRKNYKQIDDILLIGMEF